MILLLKHVYNIIKSFIVKIYSFIVHLLKMLKLFLTFIFSLIKLCFSIVFPKRNYVLPIYEKPILFGANYKYNTINKRYYLNAYHINAKHYVSHLRKRIRKEQDFPAFVQYKLGYLYFIKTNPGLIKLKKWVLRRKSYQKYFYRNIYKHSIIRHIWRFPALIRLSYYLKLFLNLFFWFIQISWFIDDLKHGEKRDKHKYKKKTKQLNFFLAYLNQVEFYDWKKQILERLESQLDYDIGLFFEFYHILYETIVISWAFYWRGSPKYPTKFTYMHIRPEKRNHEFYDLVVNRIKELKGVKYPDSLFSKASVAAYEFWRCLNSLLKFCLILICSFFSYIFIPFDVLLEYIYINKIKQLNEEQKVIEANENLIAEAEAKAEAEAEAEAEAKAEAEAEAEAEVNENPIIESEHYIYQNGIFIIDENASLNIPIIEDKVDENKVKRKPPAIIINKKRIIKKYYYYYLNFRDFFCVGPLLFYVNFYKRIRYFYHMKIRIFGYNWLMPFDAFAKRRYFMGLSLWNSYKFRPHTWVYRRIILKHGYWWYHFYKITVFFYWYKLYKLMRRLWCFRGFFEFKKRHKKQWTHPFFIFRYILFLRMSRFTYSWWFCFIRARVKLVLIVWLYYLKVSLRFLRRFPFMFFSFMSFVLRSLFIYIFFYLSAGFSAIIFVFLKAVKIILIYINLLLSFFSFFLFKVFLCLTSFLKYMFWFCSLVYYRFFPKKKENLLLAKSFFYYYNNLFISYINRFSFLPLPTPFPFKAMSMYNRGANSLFVDSDGLYDIFIDSTLSQRRAIVYRTSIDNELMIYTNICRFHIHVLKYYQKNMNLKFYEREKIFLVRQPYYKLRTTYICTSYPWKDDDGGRLPSNILWKTKQKKIYRKKGEDITKKNKVIVYWECGTGYRPD